MENMFSHQKADFGIERIHRICLHPRHAVLSYMCLGLNSGAKVRLSDESYKSLNELVRNGKYPG